MILINIRLKNNRLYRSLADDSEEQEQKRKLPDFPAAGSPLSTTEKRESEQHSGLMPPVGLSSHSSTNSHTHLFADPCLTLTSAMCGSAEGGRLKELVYFTSVIQVQQFCC